ncbi:MAG: 16S rRNA (guanine(527)-N(7))-methyltransferase RsmG [Bacteroidota bacterium]|nr:16S rRNA (guanine(527)-N(7))-methyltransferase RsmG [Candidatus Kapabacteria bacterium]MCX7936089.1 16S rRNA (guanine(527)-N(7))-methyltransferase RsmG [Chlorobiota bacterium]MDW8075017.1 16S rRNA (guanine(527)-N(7))-methyltransferase RsmG [Bacteroidota bacterium]MDW8271656.1 16S rRNA (guanine(527)-N(7))-methyltransferase RsmG [Bacteroidota bacterium]
MDLAAFWTICSANGIVLDRDQLRAIERFERELRYWNERINLVSRKDIDHVLERHILHSLAILTVVDIPQKARCLDVGTGGGLPGIPLIIARPDLRMVLVDSIRKKLRTAEMLAKHTGHRFTEAYCIRVEELAKQKPSFRAAFDVILARAVADTRTLLSWTRELVKPSGMHILLKGGDLSAEIAQARAAFPEALIMEHPLRLRGAPWLEEQQKKVLIVTWQSSPTCATTAPASECVSHS